VSWIQGYQCSVHRLWNHCQYHRVHLSSHASDIPPSQALLSLNGPACNTYGQDINYLTLKVTYETDNRLHVQIYDTAQNVYQVPESVFPRPAASGDSSSSSSQLVFNVIANPFSFSVSRRGQNRQTLFDTRGTNIVFQSQYLRLRTRLPQNPHLYGLGEHTDPFMVSLISNASR
jgi:alpha-glucosidase